MSAQPEAYTFEEKLELDSQDWSSIPMWAAPGDPNVWDFYDYPMFWKLRGPQGREWILYACADEKHAAGDRHIVGWVASPRKFGMVDVWEEMCSGTLECWQFFTIGTDQTYPRLWIEWPETRVWKLPQHLIPEGFPPEVGLTMAAPVPEDDQTVSTNS